MASLSSSSMLAGSPNYLLLEATKVGDIKTISQLITSNENSGVDVNCPDGDGQTAMHWAALHSDKSILKLLIEHSGNVLVQDHDRNTPLHWAAKVGVLEVAEYLRQEGGNAFAKNGNGETSLTIAIKNKRVEMADMLQATDDMADAFSPSQSPVTWATVGRKEVKPTEPVAHKPVVLKMVSDASGCPSLPLPPPQTPAPRTTTYESSPSKETSSSITFTLSGNNHSGLEIYPTSVLRCVLPAWCVGRLLRHVSVQHRSVGSSNVDLSQHGAYNHVRVWGCSLGSATRFRIGMSVILFGLAAKEYNGLFGTIVRRHRDNVRLEVTLKTKEGAQTIMVKGSNLRIIYDHAQWWNYRNTTVGYDSKRGLFAPLRSQDNPVTALYQDWNSHVGLLYPGTIEIVGSGQNTASFSIIHEVKIEFFPENYLVVDADLQIDIDPDDFVTNESKGVEDTEGGASLLHWAAWKNDVEAAAALLDMHPSAQDKLTEAGSTPLHWAAKQQSYEVAELLLLHNAKPDCRNMYGITPLSLALKSCNEDLICLLKTSLNGPTNIHGAVDDNMISQILAGGLGLHGEPEQTSQPETSRQNDTPTKNTPTKSPNKQNNKSPNQNKTKNTQTKSPKQQQPKSPKQTPHSSPPDGRSQRQLVKARRVKIVKQKQEKMGFRLHSPVGYAGTRIIGIVPKGPADRAGNLKEGDLIVAIQGVSATSMSHDEVVKAIKAAGNDLELLVAEPKRMITEVKNVSSPESLIQDPKREMGKSRLSAKSTAVQLRRFEGGNPGNFFPVGSPAPLETFRHPEAETCNSVTFNLDGGILLSNTQHLRIELPAWCSTRVLQTITVTQQNVDSRDGSTSCHNNMVLYNTNPVSTRVAVWGACIEDEGSATGKQAVGRTIALCDHQFPEICGLLGVAVKPWERDEICVKLLESKKVVQARRGHCQFTEGCADWWEYKNNLHYDPAVGMQAGIAQNGLTSVARFDNWCGNVAPLLVGALDVSPSGQGDSIVRSVHVEFFPQRVPIAKTINEIQSLTEMFSNGTHFRAFNDGVSGLLTASKVSLSTVDAIQVGAGWINWGSKYAAAKPFSDDNHHDCHVDAMGDLHIPLPKGRHIIGFEIAARNWPEPTDPDTLKWKNSNPGCRLWVHFPRSDMRVLDNVQIPQNNLLFCGPLDHDFVAVDGDEIVVGTKSAPALVQGFRVIHVYADPQLAMVNNLRKEKEAAAKNVMFGARQMSIDQMKQNLNIEMGLVKFNTDNTECFSIGSFGPSFYGQFRGQAYIFNSVTRLDSFTDELLRSQFAGDVAALTMNSGHTNVLRICGVYDSSTAVKVEEFSVNLCLMLEYCAGGTLRDHIDKHGNGDTAPASRFNLLEQIANGMDYLHTRKPQAVVHGNLKASVVLLRHDQSPCISDYGLNDWRQRRHDALELASQKKSWVIPASSPQWAAPELWESNIRPTTLSDIYAFAILAFEVFTAHVPWEGVALEHLYSNLQQGQRPVLGISDFWDGESDIELLVRRCWHQDGSCRPDNFLNIAEHFRELQKGNHVKGADGQQQLVSTADGLLPEIMTSPSLPWELETPRGKSICHLDDTPANLKDAGMTLTLRQQIISLCAESSAQNETLERDFDLGRISVLRDPNHDQRVYGKLTQLLHKEPPQWSLSRIAFGDRSFANSSHHADWRRAVTARLEDLDLYRRVRFEVKNPKAPSVVTAFCVAHSESAALVTLSSRGHAVASGLYGKGIHAFLDIHHAIEAVESIEGTCTLVVAHAVFSHAFPITGAEMPGEVDELVGRDIVTPFDAHVLCSLRGDTTPLSPKYWSIANPSMLMVFREDCFFPFATLSVQKKSNAKA